MAAHRPPSRPVTIALLSLTASPLIAADFAECIMGVEAIDSILIETVLPEDHRLEVERLTAAAVDLCEGGEIAEGMERLIRAGRLIEGHGNPIEAKESR